MKKIVIAGANSAIAKSLISKLLIDREVIGLGRNNPGIDHANFSFHHHDVLSDEVFPMIDSSLDGLVYMPGSIRLKPLKMLKMEDFQADMHLNFFAGVNFVKSYLPNILQSERGSILFFSTVAVQTGMPFHTSISAAKGALEGFARSLAAELAPRVNVNVIAPSLTDTPLANSLINSDVKLNASRERHPMKSIGEADDIAALGHFLLSDAAKFITGQIIKADGGISSVKIS